jgi:hypothetical protein
MTSGERLRIARRRAGESQAEAAKRLGLPLHAYKRAEADDPGQWSIPRPQLGALQPFESCHLQRIREGRTLRNIAALMGVSTWWLCQMERGKVPADALVEFWSIR